MHRRRLVLSVRTSSTYHEFYKIFASRIIQNLSFSIYIVPLLAHSRFFWNFDRFATGSYLIHLPQILQNLSNLIQNLLFSVYIVPRRHVRNLLWNFDTSMHQRRLVLSVRRHRYLTYHEFYKIYQTYFKIFPSRYILFLYLHVRSLEFRCTEDAWKIRLYRGCRNRGCSSDECTRDNAHVRARRVG